MLTLDHLRAVRLHERPPGQVAFANLFLRFDYRLPSRTEIVLEGTEHLDPDRRYMLAMNHTDRFNYWPFQYEMYRSGRGFTATWVKGKYYENRWMKAFLDVNNNIPLPSRGYVITVWFRGFADRTPSADEYRALRDLVDGRRAVDEPLPAGAGETVRAMLDAKGGAAGWLAAFEAHFDAMMREVVRLNREAMGRYDNHILVFPQGTRSVRLTPGHDGIAQMSQYLGAAIVPIGCNGSDRLYPGNSPSSNGGRVVYRIGRPLEVDGPELRAHRVPSDVLPFTRRASAAHGDAYRAITDVVMDRINELLDPPDQRATETDDVGRGDVGRFV